MIVKRFKLGLTLLDLFCWLIYMFIAKHMIKFENYVWFQLNNCQIQANLWSLDKSGQIFFYLTSCKIYDGWNHSLRNTNILLHALPSEHLPSIWQLLWSSWFLLSTYGQEVDLSGKSVEKCCNTQKYPNLNDAGSSVCSKTNIFNYIWNTCVYIKYSNGNQLKWLDFYASNRGGVWNNFELKYVSQTPILRSPSFGWF